MVWYGSPLGKYKNYERKRSRGNNSPASGGPVMEIRVLRYFLTVARDSFQSTKVLFTGNLSTNGALMVQRGLAYSIAVEGSVPFWDKEKIIYRPLYPELKANSALVWKKHQPFTLAADKFIEHLKYSFSTGDI